METATWILVVILSITLFIFLVVGIIVGVRFIKLLGEANKIVVTGQQIANKTEGIVENVKGVTSVGAVVQNFTDHIIDHQKRRYAREEAAMAAAEEAVNAAAEKVKHASRVIAKDNKSSKDTKKK